MNEYPGLWSFGWEFCLEFLFLLASALPLAGGQLELVVDIVIYSGPLLNL